MSREKMSYDWGQVLDRTGHGLAPLAPVLEGQGQGHCICGPDMEGQGQVRQKSPGPGPDRTSDSLYNIIINLSMTSSLFYHLRAPWHWLGYPWGYLWAQASADEPSSSIGMYFRIFAHFASRVTLAVMLTSSRPCYCSAEVILLLTVFSLLVHLLFCLFRFFRFCHAFPGVTRNVTHRAICVSLVSASLG